MTNLDSLSNYYTYYYEYDKKQHNLHTTLYNFFMELLSEKSVKLWVLYSEKQYKYKKKS